MPLTRPHHMTDRGSSVHEDRMRGQWARWYLYPPSVGMADTVNPVRKRTLHSQCCCGVSAATKPGTQPVRHCRQTPPLTRRAVVPTKRGKTHRPAICIQPPHKLEVAAGGRIRHKRKRLPSGVHGRSPPRGRAVYKLHHSNVHGKPRAQLTRASSRRYPYQDVQSWQHHCPHRDAPDDRGANQSCGLMAAH